MEGEQCHDFSQASRWTPGLFGGLGVVSFAVGLFVGVYSGGPALSLGSSNPLLSSYTHTQTCHSLTFNDCTVTMKFQHALPVALASLVAAQSGDVPSLTEALASQNDTLSTLAGMFFTYLTRHEDL